MAEVHRIEDDIEHEAWIKLGMTRLEDYLARWAKVDEYCALRGHRIDSKGLER